MNDKQKKLKKKKVSSIKILPLGGCNEIGKNCTVIEYKDEIVVIDCGVMFPESGMHGIDLVIPDMTYLYKNSSKVKAILLTHGHEDHIGALPYLIKIVNAPIYGGKFTLGLLENRLKEHGLFEQVELNITEYRKPFKVGSFNIEFVKTTHSIADSAAILLDTPLGKVLHTGDFKIDHSPIDGKPFDFYRFAELGENGLLALLSDSTNINKDGYTLSEKVIYQVLRDAFRRTKGRIFIATFASNIHRIQIVFDVAKEFNKKVAVSGRSMEGNIQIAKELGYLSFSEDVLHPIEDLKSMSRNHTVLITTGTQGEPMSALSLLANEKHKWLMIEKGDMVIISASVIPGNEKGVSKIINSLMKAGANVIYEAIEDIHVSGHGCREELKMMISLVRPKFFIPIHGEYRHLVNHSKMASLLGIPESRIQVLENGDMVEITPNSMVRSGYIDCQQVFVDGKGVGDIGTKVIRDRQVLSEDGIVVVIVTNQPKNGKKVYKPEIISRGFVYIKDSSEIFKKAENLVLDIAKEYSSNGLENDFNSFNNKIRMTLRDFFYKETRRKPIIITRIIEK